MTGSSRFSLIPRPGRAGSRSRASLRGRRPLEIAILLGLLAGSPALFAQGRTDFDGNILTSSWLILGPFANPFGCTNDANILGNHIAPACIRCEYPDFEDAIDYDAAEAASTGYVGPLDEDGKPYWRIFDDGSDDADQNLEGDVGGALDDVMSWLVTYVENEDDEDIVVDLCVGSDDGVQVWLDDRLVWNNNACRGRALGCQDLVPGIVIAPGAHRIAIAAWERGGDWGLSLALREEGLPIVDGESVLVFHGPDRPSGIAAAVECQCPCPAVENLVANGESGRVQWSLPADAAGCAPIRVLVDGAFIEELPADATNYTLEADVLAGAGEVCVDNRAVVPPCTALLQPDDLCLTNATCSRHPDGVAITWERNLARLPESVTVTRDGTPIEGSPFPGSSELAIDAAPGDGPFTYALTATWAEPFAELSCPATECVFDGTAATIFLVDDFESYASDAEFEAAGWRREEVNTPVEVGSIWTVTNPASRKNPPSVNGTPTVGRFAISDSDFSGGEDVTGSGQSHDLWTPPFSTRGSDSVWLHVDCGAQLNNNGIVVFDIDVSVDGGEEWENAFRRVAPTRSVDPLPDRTNTDGFFGRLHVDLSDFAANESDVIVRFRQFEPHDDWWIALDNLAIDDVPAPRGGATRLVEENFDDLIPDDWTIDSRVDPANEGSATWTTDDDCFRDPSPGIAERGINRLDAPYALLDAGCTAGVKDEYLITPVLDLSSAESVFIHFSSEILIDAGATCEVLVSTDGGETFLASPIFTYSPDSLFDSQEEPFFAERVLAAPRAAGERRVAFAFHFRTATATNWWAIDDVVVSADLSGATPFLRGDATGEGTINLTDGIYILNFLFLGGPESPCRESMDVDNSAAINISDGIAVFGFLFLGAGPPADPGPTVCGPDPDAAGTPGDLGCSSYAGCR